METKKDSGFGIASVILNCIIFIILIIAPAELFQQQTSLEIGIYLIFIFLIFLLSIIIAFVLGIIGLFQKNRKKIFAILGIIFSLVLIVLLMIIKAKSFGL